MLKPGHECFPLVYALPLVLMRGSNSDQRRIYGALGEKDAKYQFYLLTVFTFKKFIIFPCFFLSQDQGLLLTP